MINELIKKYEQLVNNYKVWSKQIKYMDMNNDWEKDRLKIYQEILQDLKQIKEEADNNIKYQTNQSWIKCIEKYVLGSDE